MKEPALKLENVSKTMNGEKILDNISWEIGRNEHWAMLGPNGAGKTTLMKIVTGYLWPSEGAVTVLGKEFGSYDLRRLRKSIGYVDSTLLRKVPFQDTVLEVVLSGKFATLGLYDELSKSERKRAEEILERLGSLDLKERKFGDLSQGEKQKVMIGRALMAGPRLLVLDEPALGLDPGSRERFLEIVENIGNIEDGPTLIYITHHVREIMPLFEKGIVLKGGRMLCKGTVSEILRNETLTEAFDADIKVIERNGRYTISQSKI